MRRRKEKGYTHHDQILGIGQTPRGCNVQDAGRVRFWRAEAASDDGRDGGVGKEFLQKVGDRGAFL